MDLSYLIVIAMFILAILIILLYFEIEKDNDIIEKDDEFIKFL